MRNYDGFVLVDMWADWCTPCKMLAPQLDTVAGQLKGKLKVVSLDTETNLQTASAFNVMSLPTMILMQNGALVGQMVGFRPASAIVEWLQGLGVDTSSN